ncbi:response regulator transcription factor [Alkalicoccobacillus gibsonii]|uniref:response regulator transcription factor n=1 Tax=Alkalicoccobacillus gibsonii TaxID=79881 RepID=UPI00351123E1
MTILVVEDDRAIAEGLSYSLKQEGYDVRLCENTKAAKQVIEQELESITLCLLDLTLPDGSGYELCQLVKGKADLPVIFLTAMDEEVNVVMGLDMGADDYITKPFRVRELTSRIKSVLRRYSKQTSSPQSNTLSIGPIEVHILEAKVYKRGQEIVLTALEYRLLMIFAAHPGQVLSRAQLLDRIWDVGGEFVNDNTLTVYIKRLREKLEDDPHQPEMIQTVRGLGYKAGDGHATS